MYGRGLKRSAPERTAHLRPLAVRVPEGRNIGWSGHREVAAALSSPLPNDPDLGPFTPRLRTINGRKGAFDQGRSSACTWHALSAGLYTACAAQGFELPAVLSMDLGYKIMRAKERARFDHGHLDPLQDTGGELSDAIEVAGEYGVVPFTTPASDGRYSDVDPATVNDEPNPELIQQAGLTLITGPYTIDPNSPDVMEILFACLTKGIPIYCGFYADKAFERLKSGQVATAPIVTDSPEEGGHAGILTGGRTDSQSRRQVRDDNSWGDGWCEAGSAWCDEAWVRSCWELRPLLIQHIAPRAA